MTQVTDELRVLVEAEVERAVRELEKFDKSIEKTEKSSGSLGDALKGVEKQALIMSGAIIAAGGASVKFAAENEKLKASLDVLLGSADKATEIFEEWKVFGSTTPLSVEEISGAGKALLAFGVDADDVTDTLRRLGDVAQGIGANLGSVADVYGKVKVQGKASAMEINQLQRQGVPIVQALAQALGTTEGKIKEMVSAGKIGFPEFEKAFKTLTEDGGKFEGMMERLSSTTMGKFSSAMDNAQQAAASFGDLLLPMVNKILDSADGLFQGLQNMDDGTKRFILGLGGVVAVSGPAIASIRAIGAAMTALMANPWMLAIGGVIAAAGLVAGYVNKQAHAYEDLKNKIRETEKASNDLLASFSGGDSAKKMDKETTEKLIKLYPELSGKIRENTTTVEEAAKAVADLAYQKRKAAAEASREHELTQMRGDLGKINLSKEVFEQGLRDGVGDPALLKEYEEQQRRYVAKIMEIEKWILDEAGSADLSFHRDAPSIVIDPPSPDDSSTKNAVKKWQEWYAEITKVDLKAITMKDQGEALGELFIDSLSDTATMNQNLAEVLGEKFDMGAALRSQRDGVESALRELLSISPSDIDDPFEFTDQFINPLAEKFKALQKDIINDDFQKQVDDLTKKIEEVGKSEWELAYNMAIANGYTEEQAREIERLTEEYALLSGKTQDATRTLEDVIRKGLYDLFPDVEKQALDCLASISAGIANISFDGVLEGLANVGEAFATGGDYAESFQAAIAEMSQRILDMLPGMFLQAGLQLIISGQWALGLGFIAAAGSTALIQGYVRGKNSEAKEQSKANAHGNIYGEDGAFRFAHGGAFTNQIVTAPTYFRHGGGLGLMGEAGPEAIVPLKRMGNGDLGIAAGRDSAPVVTVNIINNTGEEVKTEERDDGDGGKDITVIIGGLVNNHIASGKADRVMGARYGVRAGGV